MLSIMLPIPFAHTQSNPGTIVVADGAAKAVFIQPYATGVTPRAIYSGTPYFDPWGVAIDRDSSIVVSDVVRVIFRQSSSGGAPTCIFGNSGKYPNSTYTGSVCPPADGNGAPYYGPFGVAVDSKGDIIVADVGAHAIFRQSPAGGPPTPIYSGSPYMRPTGVTIVVPSTPVPEFPAGASAILVGALLIVGLVMRRSRLVKSVQPSRFNRG